MEIKGTEKLNSICEAVISLNESDIKETAEMYQEQLNYTNPIDRKKQLKFNELGEFNRQAMDLILKLKEHLEK